MDAKKIQEQRTKGYFIEAAKEILKGEGVKSISVRNVASRAGYSYATLYNYFKDIKDLIFLCVKDFQDDCEEIIKGQIKGKTPGKERIKLILKGYVGYFNQYPGIFELFFIETMSDISSNKDATDMIASFTERLCENDWRYCIKQGVLSENDAQTKMQTLNLVLTGALVMYLNRRFPGSYKEFQGVIEHQIDSILG